MLLWSVVDPIVLGNVVWIGEHRGFTMRAYFENMKSMIKSFRRRFNFLRNNAVPDASRLLFERELSGWLKLVTLKTGKHKRPRFMKTRENVQLVIAVVE